MAVAFKDYYRVLGVAPTATDDEIRKAFRSLARKYHPDVARDKKSAEEKFKEINEAQEVLSNAESRRKYDRLGAEWRANQESGPTPRRPGGERAREATHEAENEYVFGGTGFSDFFERFFGGRAEQEGGDVPFESAESGRGFGRAPMPRRGSDIQGDILISLDEVLKGAERAISVRRDRAGTGQEDTETYQVRIPRGVRAGQLIRVSGKGGEGTNGGSPGDIYLRVRYARHPDWQVRGPDLIGVLRLAPWEAVLGAQVPVATLDGRVSVKVPPGFQQGQQLRVRGRGLPAGNAKNGDLYLEASIQVPAHVGPEEERLWRALAGASAFNPRQTV